MLWHEQSWPQIESLDRQLPVVVPLGSLEQHGKHLPLFVDSIQVESVAKEVEKRLADRMLLLPTLWLGCSEHHMDFPGTVSVAPSLYSKMIKSVTRCILHAGFRRICFLNGHGGNDTPGAQALTEMIGEDDDADNAYLVFTSWWQIARPAIVPEKVGTTAASITHACEYETSMMLAIRPDLVHKENAVERPPVLTNEWIHSPGGARVRMFRRFHRLTASGSMGKPSLGSEQKGRAIHEGVVKEIAAFLADFRAWPELPPIRA
jgi:creatinine amidohydrolase